jgi:2-C-methyl-D-erythritol 4-phosphate cytidylyltransferase
MLAATARMGLSAGMTSAVIVAAGASRRMGFDKLAASLAGLPVAVRSLIAFQGAAEIGCIILVAGDDLLAVLGDLEALAPKLVAVVPGGDLRHRSVLAGLRATPPDAGWVAVHDAARPLVSPAAIDAVCAHARNCGAAVLARPVADTLKRADAAGRVAEAVERERLWAMETPQVARRDWLLAALAAADDQGLAPTDEVSALQAAGHPVEVVRSTAPNFKITWPEDLALAERLLAR